MKYKVEMIIELRKDYTPDDVSGIVDEALRLVMIRPVIIQVEKLDRNDDETHS